jgi:hypothetical protein
MTKRSFSLVALACQICVDPSGKIYDDCRGGTGSGGATVPEKCDVTTDAKTSETCWAPHGTVTASDCAPPAQPGTAASCTASQDATGQLCKVCSDDGGKIVFTDCGG